VSAETRALSIVNGSGDGSVGAGQAADILLLLRLVFVASEYKYGDRELAYRFATGPQIGYLIAALAS
jgi:hypothetical protein